MLDSFQLSALRYQLSDISLRPARDTVSHMSERNGDKSRYQINRKRAVLRRAKQREAAQAGPAAPKRFAKAKTTPPRSARP